jgi:endonuclease/exonuclease/phosphatase family metal-dependent hydrolase
MECSPMRLTIATWNMDHWKRSGDPGHTRAAWEYLETLSPNVALVQEATSPLTNGAVTGWKGQSIPPATEPASWQISPTRRWGSAVVSYGPALTEVPTARTPYSSQDVPLRGTHPGCVAVAQAVLPDQCKLTLISAYGLIDAGYSVTTLHRILSDLTPLFDDKRYNAHVVLGGDLNGGTQAGEGDRHLARHRLVFERIKAFGLVDCLDAKLGENRPLPGCPCGDASCRHVQTHRHLRSSKPWQNDYVFASDRLATKLTACYAHDVDAAWALSDHCPVIAEFDL